MINYQQLCIMMMMIVCWWRWIEEEGWCLNILTIRWWSWLLDEPVFLVPLEWRELSFIHVPQLEWLKMNIPKGLQLEEWWQIEEPSCQVRIVDHVHDVQHDLLPNSRSVLAYPIRMMNILTRRTDWLTFFFRHPDEYFLSTWLSDLSLECILVFCHLLVCVCSECQQTICLTIDWSSYCLLLEIPSVNISTGYPSKSSLRPRNRCHHEHFFLPKESRQAKFHDHRKRWSNQPRRMNSPRFILTSLRDVNLRYLHLSVGIQMWKGSFSLKIHRICRQSVGIQLHKWFTLCDFKETPTRDGSLFCMESSYPDFSGRMCVTWFHWNECRDRWRRDSQEIFLTEVNMVPWWSWWRRRDVRQRARIAYPDSSCIQI